MRKKYITMALAAHYLPAGAVGGFDLTVRLRQQRHYLANQDDIALAVTNNSYFGTTVLAFVANRHNNNSSMLTCIGKVDSESWFELMEVYEDSLGVPFPRQRWGGPRVGETSTWTSHNENVYPNIWDAHLINVPGPLQNGAWDPDGVTVRVFW